MAVPVIEAAGWYMKELIRYLQQFNIGFNWAVDYASARTGAMGPVEKMAIKTATPMRQNQAAPCRESDTLIVPASHQIGRTRGGRSRPFAH